MKELENIRKGHRIVLETNANDNHNTEYRFKIEYYVFTENDTYIAYCPSLDLSTSGKTFNEVISNFYEMFELYIETCIEYDTLHDDLIAHGWKLTKKDIQPPTFSSLMKKPEMRKLIRGNIGFEKIVTPVRIPAVV
jgi:predicted RNase H-like HicB family nuclease